MHRYSEMTLTEKLKLNQNKHPSRSLTGSSGTDNSNHGASTKHILQNRKRGDSCAYNNRYDFTVNWCIVRK